MDPKKLFCTLPLSKRRKQWRYQKKIGYGYYLNIARLFKSIKYIKGMCMTIAVQM